MATKIHDYTKPYRVNMLLTSAQKVLRSDIGTVEELINQARQLLDEYLASDNLIPDDDE